MKHGIKNTKAMIKEANEYLKEYLELLKEIGGNKNGQH